jgi:hypothetical protein
MLAHCSSFLLLLLSGFLLLAIDRTSLFTGTDTCCLLFVCCACALSPPTGGHGASPRRCVCMPDVCQHTRQRCPSGLGCCSAVFWDGCRCDEERAVEGGQRRHPQLQACPYHCWHYRCLLPAVVAVFASHCGTCATWRVLAPGSSGYLPPWKRFTKHCAPGLVYVCTLCHLGSTGRPGLCPLLSELDGLLPRHGEVAPTTALGDRNGTHVAHVPQR